LICAFLEHGFIFFKFRSWSNGTNSWVNAAILDRALILCCRSMVPPLAAAESASGEDEDGEEMIGRWMDWLTDWLMAVGDAAAVKRRTGSLQVAGLRQVDRRARMNNKHTNASVRIRWERCGAGRRLTVLHHCQTTRFCCCWCCNCSTENGIRNGVTGNIEVASCGRVVRRLWRLPNSSSRWAGNRRLCERISIRFWSHTGAPRTLLKLAVAEVEVLSKWRHTVEYNWRGRSWNSGGWGGSTPDGKQSDSGRW